MNKEELELIKLIKEEEADNIYSLLKKNSVLPYLETFLLSTDNDNDRGSSYEQSMHLSNSTDTLLVLQ